MELYHLVAVIDRERVSGLESIFMEAGTTVSLSQPASGTAGSEILKRIGLNRTRKCIVRTVANHMQQKQIFQLARKKLFMDIPGNGILVAIPIKAIVGKQTLHYLAGNEITGGIPSMDFEYEMIIAVVNEGYSDIAMDAAREAGAGGGTVLHAKGTGGDRAKEFFNVRFADEKDMIYIVAHKSEKQSIMRSIISSCGPQTDARGVCFSLPISSVMGLRSREMDTLD